MSKFYPIPVTRPDAGGPLWAVGTVVDNQFVEGDGIPSHSWDVIKQRCDQLNSGAPLLFEALSAISLTERDTASSDHEKVRSMAAIARNALARMGL